MVLLVPELTFLTGLSDLGKNSRMLKVRACLIPLIPFFPEVWGSSQSLPDCWLFPVQEVMWEMIQSPQQHYQRLTSLLCRIRDTPEASQELEGWGLRLDTDIFRVSAAGAPSLPSGRGDSSKNPPRAQTQGHILPVERINLRHRSFLPAEDLSWHREVTKEAPIAVVSSSLPSLGKLGWLFLSPGIVAEQLPAQSLALFVLDLRCSLFFRRSWRYVAVLSAFPPRPRVEGAFHRQELDGIQSKFLLGHSPKFLSVLQISLGPLSQVPPFSADFSWTTLPKFPSFLQISLGPLSLLIPLCSPNFSWATLPLPKFSLCSRFLLGHSSHFPNFPPCCKFLLA